MGIKRNFIFSTILTASNYIFPFIIYPYVARVLGVNNIGIVNFVDGIVNYAMMLSLMGIAVVGVREIAKVKNDRAKLDATFTSLMVLLFFFTTAATVLLVGATMLVPDLEPYRPLLWIGVVKVWSNFLLIDWLYRGLEEFRYITVRTILIKMGYLVCVFIFVHNASDYVVYYVLMCLMVTVNAVFNCVRAMRYVSLRLDWKMVRVFTVPFVILGVYILLNSMYTTFNVIYLGFKWGDEEVGFYTTSTKIFNIILAVYTAYSTVVVPRASALLSENRFDEFRSLLGKSLDALILFSIPVVVFGMMFSSGIIYLVGGPEYGGAIVPMIIVMPLIFIIGYEQILVVQTLTPLGMDRVILRNSIVGATVGIVGNILLVGRLAAIGSSVVWLMAEIAVLISAQYFVTKRVGLQFPFVKLGVNLLAYVPFIAIAFAINRFVPVAAIPKMLIGLVVVAVYFYVVQSRFLRNEIFIDFHTKIASRLNRKR